MRCDEIEIYNDEAAAAVAFNVSGTVRREFYMYLSSEERERKREKNRGVRC